MRKKLKKIIVTILTLEARFALFFWRPKIIAVTGSVGKTSTKDAIYSIFSKLSTARRSKKSFNSEIGVPLAILDLPNGWNNPILWFLNIIRGFFVCLKFIIFSINYKLRTKNLPEWLILEIGADRPGDIEEITKWVRPDIAVVNKIGDVPVHVEFFASPEELAKEKSFLAKALHPNGTLVYYGDDEKVAQIAKNHKLSRLIKFGFDEGADVTASNYTIVYKKADNSLIPSGVSFKINYAGNVLPIVIEGALGRQHAYPILAAVSVAIAAKLNLVTAINALRDHQTPPGRMKLIDGLKNSLIVDDSYNSSPTALLEALATLREIEITKGRKFAVLGDMLELGNYSFTAHHDAGAEAAKVCDILCTVGDRARTIAEGALENGLPENNIFQYDSSEKAGDEIQNMIGEGDIILIKGSQGVRMEKVVEEIMLEPEKAGELLVRQEKEWEGR